MRPKRSKNDFQRANGNSNETQRRRRQKTHLRSRLLLRSRFFESPSPGPAPFIDDGLRLRLLAGLRSATPGDASRSRSRLGLLRNGFRAREREKGGGRVERRRGRDESQKHKDAPSGPGKNETSGTPGKGCPNGRTPRREVQKKRGTHLLGLRLLLLYDLLLLLPRDLSRRWSSSYLPPPLRSRESSRSSLLDEPLCLLSPPPRRRSLDLLLEYETSRSPPRS